MPYGWLDQLRIEKIKANKHRSWKKHYAKYKKARQDKSGTPSAYDINLKKYGMTDADYHALLEKQGGHCALCSATENGARGKRLFVDHDHRTGKVRGLVCHKCNVVLIACVDNYSEEQLTLAKKYICVSTKSDV